VSTPEAKVKKFVDDRMKQWFPSATKYSPPGIGVFGKNGFPDRLWFIGATEDVCVVVAIEAKAEGKKLTELQLARLLELRKNGAIVASVIGKDADKLRRVRDEVLRRVSVASSQPGPQAVRPPSKDD
jgi:hypothetical protein